MRVTPILGHWPQVNDVIETTLLLQPVQLIKNSITSSGRIVETSATIMNLKGTWGVVLSPALFDWTVWPLETLTGF